MFLHPWAIALGVLAAGLPVLIHWLTRPRPRRFPLSTLRFVREAVQERRAFWRLRDALVLTLRVLAVLTIAAAVARPWLGQAAVPERTDDARVVRVVVLDVSQSMAARTGAVQAFERARPLAAQHLEYEPGLAANLILAGARPSAVFAHPSTNFAALHEALAQARPLPQRLRAQEALNLAADMLAAHGRDRVQRELVVISDFQRTNWANADFSPLPADARIRLESMASETAPTNLAVLSVSAPGRVEVGREARLEIEVGNFSQTAFRARLEAEVGSSVFRMEGDCAALGRTTLFGDFVSQEAGWQVGRARLLDIQDALPDDDVRALAIEVRLPPVYALITRQTEQQRPSSSYFLARALSPYEPDEQRQATKIVRLQPERVDREALGAAAAVVLDHPGRLSHETVQLLAALHKRGRGILYVAAEPIDATNLKLLAEAIGGGLQLPVEFLPPNGPVRRNLFVTQARGGQPPFGIFGDQLSALVGELRISGGLVTRRLPEGLAEDVLATFNDQTAFLVASASETGDVAVLNADLEESNLHSSPLFVPMIGELMQQKLSGRRHGDGSLACGEPFAVLLPPEVEGTSGLQLTGSQGDWKSNESLAQEAQGVLWRGEAAAAPGAYPVRRDNRTVFAVATGCPPEESDLRTLAANVFQDRLAGGRSVQFRSAIDSPRGSRDDFWTWLAMACAVCLIAETAVLRAFRT